jgi:hypothetical protein
MRYRRSDRVAMGAGLRRGDPFNPYGMFTGITLIPEGLFRCTWIGAGAKLAWGRLARYAGFDGRCHPTMKTLGKEIGVGIVSLVNARLGSRRSVENGEIPLHAVLRGIDVAFEKWRSRPARARTQTINSMRFGYRPTMTTQEVKRVQPELQTLLEAVLKINRQSTMSRGGSLAARRRFS